MQALLTISRLIDVLNDRVGRRVYWLVLATVLISSGNAIVRKLNAAMVEALKMPDVIQRLATEGSQPVGSTPEQFSAHIRNEVAKWRKLAKEANLKLQ